MKKTLLVIEDNPANMYLMHYLLENHGYRIEEAETGKKGIEKAIELIPDAILLDIQLPEMDGYDVARILKGVPQLSSVPIIAVTSYAMVGDKERALSAGATGYIEKPINPDTFVAEIEALIHSMGE